VKAVESFFVAVEENSADGQSLEELKQLELL
jgi:hypothetical protein